MLRQPEKTTIINNLNCWEIHQDNQQPISGSTTTPREVSNKLKWVITERLKIQSKCLIQGYDMFICNERLYADIQNVLAEQLMQFHPVDAAVYSKEANGKIKVGAEYSAYTFMGELKCIALL